MWTRYAVMMCTCVAMCVALVASTVEGTEPSAAQSFADKKLAELNSWKTDAVKNSLEQKQEQFGGTSSFQTVQGVLQSFDGKVSDSVTTLQKAADTDKKDPAPDYYRGLSLKWLQNQDGAKEAFRRSLNRAKEALKSDPNDPYANFYLGASQVGLRDLENARKSLNKALEKGFSAELVHYQMGLAFTFDQNWKKAREEFDKTIALNDRFAYAYYYRGRVWDKLGRKDNMLLDMDQFLKLAPNAPDAGVARTILNAAG